MYGWANLRSHLTIPFNQNHYRVCGLIMTGDLPEWKKERVVSLLWVTYPGGRMASLLWVTYPGKKMKNGLIVWATYPGKKNEEWSHCMGDLPRKNDGLIVWVTNPRKMMVSLYG